jgi:hypothetical protein
MDALSVLAFRRVPMKSVGHYCIQLLNTVNAFISGRPGSLIDPDDPAFWDGFVGKRLNRWMIAKEIESAYWFEESQLVISYDSDDLPAKGNSTPSPDREPYCGGPWPWGTHETDLLRKFAAAARRFWKNYDPSDPTTAPKNAEVVDWLKAQGVSERNAQMMATTLRADGLPTGPRK